MNSSPSTITQSPSCTGAVPLNATKNPGIESIVPIMSSRTVTLQFIYDCRVFINDIFMAAATKVINDSDVLSNRMPFGTVDEVLDHFCAGSLNINCMTSFLYLGFLTFV